jgi:hypothetical protein
MGTAHGAEELGLCPHGLACQAGAWGRYVGFCLRYGHIWPKSKLKRSAKYSARPITLAHDEILRINFYNILYYKCLRIKRGTLEMRIAVSRE